MKKRQSVLDNERGQAMVVTAIGFVAFLALAAVAVDVAHLSHVSNDVQNLADIAATAAARAVLDPGGNAVSGALPVVQQNSVDGAQPTVVLGSTCDPSSAPCAAVQPGNYSAGTFTAGASPVNAVQANAFAKAQNIIGGLPAPLAAFTSTSTVQKTATATFTGIGSGQPGLPLAIGDCGFSGDCLGSSCLTLTQAPNGTDNAAWTGFSGGTGSSQIKQYLPAACGGSGSPTIAVGDSISLTNGSTSVLKDVVDCMFCQLHQSTFLVAVVHCNGNFNQPSNVVGFTTITISSFHFSNGQTGTCDVKGGNPDGINLTETPNPSVPGPPGGGAFGTGFVVLAG